MANHSSSSSLNALKLLQERFAPGNSSDILSEEKMHIDDVRRKSNKDKRPGRPKGSVNKKKGSGTLGKGQKINKVAKLDSSDNDDDNSFNNDAVEDSNYNSKGLLHYPKTRGSSGNINCSDNTNLQQPHVFDCQECRYQAGSYEQYQDHLRKNICGPRRSYIGSGSGPPPVNGYHVGHYRKREHEPPLYHQQYNFRPHQNLYVNQYNGGPMYSQYSPRQRWYFPPQPHPDFVRGWHPMRCPPYSWNEYPHHSNVYPHSTYGYGPPPIPSAKHIQTSPYFYKSHEPQYPHASKKICKMDYSVPSSASSSVINGGQVRDNECLGPDLEEAIASIQSEDDDGSNQLVQEVIAYVDGKKQKVGDSTDHTLKRGIIEDSVESHQSFNQIIDENAYLKDCSRDPVLTATSGFVIPVTVAAEREKSNGNLEDIVNNESLVLNGNLSSDASTETIFEEENLRLIFENNFETQLCPHKSVMELQAVPASEQAKDQLKIVTLQAQLGYILTGLLGYTKLNSDYDYSRSSVHQILHKILAQSNIKPVEENYLCTQECESLTSSLDKKELYLRIIKLRLHVIRANIGKLLCICVPHRNEWKNFQWDGLTIDEILDNLTQEDIPGDHEQIEADIRNESKDQESGEPTVYLMEINEETEILQALENGGEIEIQNEENES